MGGGGSNRSASAPKPGLREAGPLSKSRARTDASLTRIDSPGPAGLGSHRVYAAAAAAAAVVVVVVTAAVMAAATPGVYGGGVKVAAR